MRIVPQKFAEINFQNIKREIWFWFGFGIMLYGMGKLLDGSSFFFIEKYLRDPLVDEVSIILTEHMIWYILASFALMTGYRAWRNPDHQTKLVAALFAVIFTAIFSFTLKSFFAIPRPFLQIELLRPLVEAPSYSFPSAHTAIAFALLIPFIRISKLIGFSWLAFALLIGFARVYQSVHFPSDIAGGIFLGGLIGTIFSNPNIKKMISVLWQELEFRRQTFHFIAGFLAVFAHWAGFFRLRFIAILLILGLIISWLSIFKKIPLVSKILAIVDRPRDQNFPGRGAYYFLLGVFLVFLIFPGEDLKIAYASILILAVGDSLNHLFDNRPEGKIKLSWNKRKNFAGLIIGVIGGTFAAQFFVPFMPALFASTMALLVESVPFRFGRYYIDDNILVPLTAGCVLWVFT